MNEIIAVNMEEQKVSARELHKSVGSTERFSTWFERQLQYGFTEDEDFTSVKTFTVVNNGAKKELQDYELSIDMAKLICQNGVEIGQKRLFQWLRDNGYLIKRKGADWNMPTQRSMEMGLFEIKESTHIDGNGCNITTRTPKTTGKGQIYFINKFLNKKGGLQNA